jgi:hypothetical protein
MDKHAADWQKLARQTRRKINFAWWLQRSGTPVALAALGTAAIALATRHFQPDWAARFLPWLAPATLIISMAAAWLTARRNFITTRDAMVRMEAHLGLHNALSAASDGARQWPDAPVANTPVTRWNWPNTLVPPLAALSFLAAGFLLPVPAPAIPIAPDEPPAWRQTEEELRQLENRKLADERSLEETRKAVEQLRARKPAEWFSHPSLEATDKLRQSHRQAMASLERQLRQSAESAARLGPGAPPLAPAARDARKEQFQQALAAMQSAGLKPNRELLEKLQAIDPAMLGQLDRMQMDELLGQLKDAADALAELQGEGKDPTARHEEKDGDQPQGNGGVDRGPGSSDDLFGEAETDLQAAKPKPLKPNDLSHSAPGDLLKTEDHAHDIQATSPAIRQGGPANLSGGGSNTWQDSLQPGEQEAMKRFFE